MLTSFISVNAQTKISEYHISYFDKTYDISAVTDKRIAWYISTPSYDTSSIIKDCGFTFEDSKYEDFIAALNILRQKYVEYKNIAQSNNVKELSKQLDVKFPRVTCYFQYGSSYHFAFNKSISARYRIHDGLYQIIIESNKLTASDNEYMTSKGILIVFSSEKEIVDFIQAIDKSKILEKESTDNLFN